MTKIRDEEKGGEELRSSPAACHSPLNKRKGTVVRVIWSEMADLPVSLIKGACNSLRKRHQNIFLGVGAKKTVLIDKGLSDPLSLVQPQMLAYSST
jgi:hypothetical protein